MDFHGQKSIFLQIADLLSEGILEGKWNVEERIPSVREFAASLEVNPNTVMRAYTYLQDLEIIINKRGIGFFVNTNAVSKIIDFKKQEFISHEIPRIAKTLKSLNLTLDDLKDLIKEFESK